jgi:hypothetical protein
MPLCNDDRGYFELIKGPSDKTTTISTILVVTYSTTAYRGSHLEK